MLNLKIISETTARLGLETHVCELRLILRSFAELAVGTLNKQQAKLARKKENDPVQIKSAK